jgi:hypothetical protein
LIHEPSIDETAFNLKGKDLFEAQISRLELRSAWRNSLMQLVGGLLVVLGAILAWLQFWHARAESSRNAEEKRSDLHLNMMDKALTQLGSPNAGMRIGGLESLTRLAELSAKYRIAAGNIVVTFIRDNSPWPPVDPRPKIRAKLDADKGPNLRTWSPETQRALDLLEANPTLTESIDQIRLRNLDLRKATLRGDRRHYLLTESELGGAYLKDADFSHSSFARSDLTNAQCGGTNFSGCNLRGTQFTGATFDRKTRFEGATFDSSTTWPDSWDDAKALAMQAEIVALDAPPTHVKKKPVVPID